MDVVENSLFVPHTVHHTVGFLWVIIHRLRPVPWKNILVISGLSTPRPLDEESCPRLVPGCPQIFPQLVISLHAHSIHNVDIFVVTQFSEQTTRPHGLWKTRFRLVKERSGSALLLDPVG